MKVSENNMANDQAYEARGVVGKLGSAGTYTLGAFVSVPIYKFLTLYQGQGKEPIAVEFVGIAPVEMDEAGEQVLNVAAVREGQFVVSPGFLYKKILMFPQLMAAHMKALPNYKPKDIISAEKANAPAVDMGTFDHTSDQVTKQ